MDASEPLCLCMAGCAYCSQVLIMPPFRKMGHATELIQAFYNEVTLEETVLDVTGTDHSFLSE